MLNGRRDALINRLTLPPALIASGVWLRCEEEGDLPFLKSLYTSTRAEELSLITAWTAAQKDAFLAMQFAAQRQHYRARWPDGNFAVIQRRETPVGRLYLAEQDAAIIIVDISLLPAHRGAGLGTGLLDAVLGLASAGGQSVRLHVAQGNPAQRLYARKGFVQTGCTDTHIAMSRHPPWTTGMTRVAPTSASPDGSADQST